MIGGREFNRRGAALAAALLLTAVLSAGARPHAPSAPADAVPVAAVPETAACSTVSEARQPVILVHGFNASSGDTWNDPTRARIYGIGRTCLAFMDYQKYSANWVTDPHIGPALATLISSYAAASKRGGGAGKVIILAHSMGGLATRCAASPPCNGNNKSAGSQILEVITLGTPNKGSALRSNHGADTAADAAFSLVSGECDLTLVAYIPGPLKFLCKQVRELFTGSATKAFTPGSPQLAALPNLPSSIPVYAEAGHVEVVTSFFGLNKGDLGDIGDVVVDESSALAAARTVDGLGGKLIIDCGILNIAVPPSIPSCTHLSEPMSDKFITPAIAQIEAAEQLAQSRIVAPVTPQNLLTANIAAGFGVTAGPMTNGGRVAPNGGGGFEGLAQTVRHSAFGDITGDGVDDAVAFMQGSGGAGGTYGWIEIFTNGGKKSLGKFDGFGYSFARMGGIDSLTISGGKVHVAWTASDNADPFSSSWTADLTIANGVVSPSNVHLVSSETGGTPVDLSAYYPSGPGTIGFYFQSPSGNITCTFDDGSGDDVRCFIKTVDPTAQNPCPTGPPEADIVNGRPVIGCQGTAPTLPASVKSLPIGSSITEFGTACVSGEHGITCKSDSATPNPGFTLSRTGTTTF